MQRSTSGIRLLSVSLIGRHSGLFRVRWAYRDFLLRQALDSEEVITHRATSSKLLAREFVKQPLQCIGFPQIGDKYPIIFKEMGTPFQEHIICPFQFVLNQLINGENFSFFLRKKDSVSLHFGRRRKNSNIASWVDDPNSECDDLPETIDASGGTISRLV